MCDTEGVACDVGIVKEEPSVYEKCDFADRKKVAPVTPNYVDDYYSPWVTYSNTFSEQQWFAEHGPIKKEIMDMDYPEYSSMSCDGEVHRHHFWYNPNSMNTRLSFTDNTTIGRFKDIYRIRNIKQEPTMAEVMLPMEDFSTPKRKTGTKRKRGDGKSKTGSPTSYTTVPLPPCKICSGVATGFHFGVITCEACKVSRTMNKKCGMRYIKGGLMHLQKYFIQVSLIAKLRIF